MDVDRADSALYLSHFVPGSAQCGIPSSRSWFSVRDGVRPDLALKGWTVDDAQDLFVTVKETQMLMPPVVDGVPDIYIHFYALSDLKADATVLTPHPAAALPLIRLPTLDSTTPKNGSWPQIIGPYVMVGIVAETGAKQWFHFVDVYNWKSGEMVSRTNIGNVHASVIPLDERYLLVFPSMGMPEPQPNLRIYTFVPSPSPSCPFSRARAGRHVCTLELPPAPPGEHAVWSQAKSGDRASEESTGHFRTDAARSVIALYIQYQGVDSERGNEEEEDGGEGDEDKDEDEDRPTGTYTYATHLLIPHATLAAQIQAAESASTSRHRQMGGGAGSDGTDTDTADELAFTVPWADWGPRGSLRLYRRGALYDGQHIVVPAPFSSRLPFVVPASDSESQNDSEHAHGESATGAGSVYVFDVNPFVARSALRSPRDRGAMTAVVDAEDIEKVLPDVVDPECSAIPFVVYRFPLPYPDAPNTDAAPGPPLAPPEIRAVTMSMAGFTVQVSILGT
ncbi:hypothetical protein GSI_02718 [Ganoderma sinense ZZ0214-1]|uniref:Uncharacterized protein n=1 Tax=Ganoderma sinense ZZ0214-1 TaxID=1077348 RepID=A0A2G8SME5_9APHY|nr:hypothetical protein GSI_02718 [Ganoderma sinense ZZ0214-1]